jgi:ABC-2 type transport system ATP-binding protein
VLYGELAGVRASFGRNTVHLGFDGDGAFLEELPGVTRASVTRNAAELQLDAGADPQRILEAATPRIRIRRFEVAAPSLEEIFLDRVGGETLARGPAEDEEEIPS